MSLLADIIWPISPCLFGSRSMRSRTAIKLIAGAFRFLDGQVRTQDWILSILSKKIFVAPSKLTV